MLDVLNEYLTAIIAHAPEKAPLAPGARATENAAKLPPGKGIWLSVRRLGELQRRYVDVASGQAAFFAIIDEEAGPSIVSLRLRVAQRRVTEAEWTVARKEYGGLFSPAELIKFPPSPDTLRPTDERSSRPEMIAAANAYFDGLEHHDGSKVPHIDGCDRIENGVKVTNRLRSQALTSIPGSVPTSDASVANGAPNATMESRSGDCTSGLEMFATTIAETSHRRFPMVDESAGVVLGSTLFHRPPGVTLKRNLLTEFFWIDRGRISAIYAAMYYLEPDAPDSTGW